ncbi:hypothetical protein OP10G_3813 [Fimbriimonas ginsengisoli Gsoil 348]|uniref:Uncharacterized protein n=1 Tax=Fimbriimonas ginsengisoli Gsoil 348 TaxID=661478 RepID=A0A068NUR1_FIMGI|nr:hypothetical protein OP10G_3813 [Fimbriimonas ginsengisoli Gsoil 348]
MDVTERLRHSKKKDCQGGTPGPSIVTFHPPQTQQESGDRSVDSSAGPPQPVAWALKRL